MKASNLAIGRFLEASVCVTLYESVTSLNRESTDSLIHKPACLVVQGVASLLRNRVTNKGYFGCNG